MMKCKMNSNKQHAFIFKIHLLQNIYQYTSACTKLKLEYLNLYKLSCATETLSSTRIIYHHKIQDAVKLILSGLAWRSHVRYCYPFTME
jgi:hypothetical protein